ncbi:MAG: caspase family protein [Candidatus Hatepunaea meridiana]|nr:caspase family protein [Candidatus Hatepunaea meridiana]
MPWKYLLTILILIGSASAQEAVKAKSTSQNVNLRYEEPDLDMSMRFLDEDGNSALDESERATVILTVENNGKGKAYDVNLSVEGSLPSNVSLDKRSVKLGLIKPGTKQDAKFILTAGDNLKDGKFDLMFKIKEKFDKNPASLQASIETLAPIPPDLTLADFKLNDGSTGLAYGNGDGKPAAGETIEITMLVQNVGAGDAFKVNASALLGEDMVQVSRLEFSLGDLTPGDSRQIITAFSIPDNYESKGRLPIKLKLTEVKGRYGKTEDLPINLNIASGSYGELKPKKVEIASLRRRAGGAPVQKESLIESVDIGIPKLNKSNKDAFAVIIGNRNYSSPNIGDVDFAVNDARTMKKYVENILGFADGNILYYENATFGQFRELFGTPANPRGMLYNYVKPGKSDLFIYYSGHGAPHPSKNIGYFVPVDVNFTPTSLENNGFPLETFYANLAEIPARSITVVLDACFSGVSDASPVGLKIKDPAQTLPNGAVFSSARKNQISNWYTEAGHSLFTYYFLKALKKAATEKRSLTAGELYDAVSDNTEGVPYWARRLYNGRDQNPMFRGDADRMIIE